MSTSIECFSNVCVCVCVILLILPLPPTDDQGDIIYRDFKVHDSSQAVAGARFKLQGPRKFVVQCMRQRRLQGNFIA